MFRTKMNEKQIFSVKNQYFYGKMKSVVLEFVLTTIVGQLDLIGSFSAFGKPLDRPLIHNYGL